MKEGDIVVCIIPNSELERGKHYRVNYVYNTYISISDDFLDGYSYSMDHFVLLSDIREAKLNDLGI